jgi:sugar phosphate isomerase/epimerase
MTGRRQFLAAALGSASAALLNAQERTKFQIACMTLPYGAFPLERALTGIRSAGYQHVAWGVNHTDTDGKRVPMLSVEAPAKQAQALGGRCRDTGLEPVMMFAVTHIEAKTAVTDHQRRIEQAAAARIPFLLTFGGTQRGEYPTFISNLKQIAKSAAGTGVTVVVKQHGGNTATGRDCARVVAEVNHPSLKICYDAGNVLDYESNDPIPDIAECWREVRAFAIKDHRNTPKDEDCGPGFGEIDHYKLLLPVMRTGLTIPLACENIFEPLVPRPRTPEGVDALARRAREFLETVLRGLEAATV